MTEEEKKEQKAAKELAKKESKGKLGEEFRKFITRGNVVDMAVGVIMGNAFGAIVTAFTNILLSIVTWGVPGGISGLATVLPAVNDVQKGLDPSITITTASNEVASLGQSFAKDNLQDLAKALAESNYGAATVATNPALIDNAKTSITGLYTLHGTTYYYNQSAVIDWGTFINAVITFLIVAVTLFAIVKIFSVMTESRLKFEAKMKEKEEEEWAKEHPEAAALKKRKEEEAAAAAAAGQEVKPDDVVLLEEIRDEIKKLNAEKAA